MRTRVTPTYSHSRIPLLPLSHSPDSQHFKHIQAKESEIVRTFGYPEIAGGLTPDWLSAAQVEQLRTDVDAR